MTYKVIMWGAGACGIYGLRHIMKHPEMELVGLRVFTPEKDGKTAGEISGLADARGADIVASTDEEKIFSIEADAVLFMDSDRTLTDPRIAGTETYVMVDKMCRLLASGKNVVATTVVGMCHPPFYGPMVYDRIEAACRKGGTTIFTTGIEPGFMSDVLPLVLSSLSHEITSVRTTQFLDYSQYHHIGTFNAYGFGKSPDDPILATTAHSDRYQIAWSVVPYAVAEGLGVTIDEIRLRTYVATTTFPFDTFAGRIEVGTVAAHRFEVIGVVAGEEKIIVEHVSRIHDDVAPEWESMGHGKGGFRIRLEGTPTMQMDLLLGLNPGITAMADAGAATAFRAANAIPEVCRATPGPKSIFDLPHIMGTGLLK